MKFIYDGTTWTPGNSEYPNYPVALGEIVDSDTRHTWEGTSRKNTNWKRPTYGLQWNNVGSAVRDHVKTWADLDSAVTFYSKYGTTDCVADGDSYGAEEVTLDNYNVSITLIGV